MTETTEPQKIVSVRETLVSCDGGVAASEHPLIYLKIGASNHVTCPYCSCTFVCEQNET